MSQLRRVYFRNQVAPLHCVADLHRDLQDRPGNPRRDRRNRVGKWFHHAHQSQDLFDGAEVDFGRLKPDMGSGFGRDLARRVEVVRRNFAFAVTFVREYGQCEGDEYHDRQRNGQQNL